MVRKELLVESIDNHIDKAPKTASQSNQCPSELLKTLRTSFCFTDSISDTRDNTSFWRSVEANRNQNNPQSNTYNQTKLSRPKTKLVMTNIKTQLIDIKSWIRTLLITPHEYVTSPLVHQAYMDAKVISLHNPKHVL